MASGNIGGAGDGYQSVVLFGSEAIVASRSGTRPPFFDLRPASIWGRLYASGVAFVVVYLLLLLVGGSAFAASATRTSSFQYDSSSGLLTQEMIEPGSGDTVTTYTLKTVYTYDAFGNKTGATVTGGTGTVGSGTAIASRSSSSTFSTSGGNNGQFATSSTNALGQSESWTYDQGLGVPLSHTGPNGLTTTWTYDGFGRMTLETRPDGTKTGYIYFYCGSIPSGEASCPNSSGNGVGGYVTKATPYASDGTTQNGPWVRSYYDALRRVYATDTQGFNGATIRQETVYDAKGRVLKTSRPYFCSGSPCSVTQTAQQWTTNTSIDDLGRTVTQQEPNGAVTTFAYHGLTMSHTNDLSQTETTVKNSQDQTVSVTDANGKVTTYNYDPFGNRATITDSAGNTATSTYNIRGQKTGSTDPDLGTWSYAYDVLGELISQTDAKSQTTTLAYDLLGRPTQRTETDLTSNWYYDDDATHCGGSGSHGIGKVCTETASNGYTRSVAYDSLGRPTTVAATIDSVTSTTTTSYDSNGRVSTVSYPSGFGVTYVYTSLGYLQNLKNTATSATLWTANTADAEGHLTQQTAGNGVVTNAAFTASTGRISTIQAGTSNAVANFSYAFDTLGNLTNRTDANQSLAETFLYDGLNRLTSYQVNSATPKTMTYDDLGNITSKSDTGTYSYNAPGGVRPHAVTAIAGTLNTTYTYDNNGNMTAGASRTVTWTAANMVAQIVQGSTTVAFAYGPDHARIKQVTASATTYYLGGVEKVVGTSGAVTWNEYLYAGSVLVGEHFTQVPVSGPTTEQTRYFVIDHLSSVAVITDETGAVVERLSYDAWGKRRYADGSDDPTGIITSQTTRGYTGQEHIPDVGIVNLNGRIYDPAIGRFMSADPFIHDVEDSQDLNRYAYVHNNPLSYTDISGYGFFKKLWRFFTHHDPFIVGTRFSLHVYGEVIKAVPILGTINQIAAGVACAPYGLSGVCSGAVAAINVGVTGGSAGDIAKAFGIAFAQGYLAGGIGDAGLGIVGTAIAQGAVGGAFAEAQGGTFLSGFLSGSVGSLGGSLAGHIIPGGGHQIADAFGKATYEGVIVSASLGGAVSVLGGGKFANGAVTASFAYVASNVANDNDSSGGRDYRTADASGAIGAASGGTDIGAALGAVGRFLSTPFRAFATALELADRLNGFYHFTGPAGYLGITSEGVILPSADGFVYLTPVPYVSGSMAQQQLSLRNTPTVRFNIPASAVKGALGPFTVAPAYGQPGGGIEYKVPHPVSTRGATSTPIDP